MRDDLVIYATIVVGLFAIAARGAAIAAGFSSAIAAGVAAIAVGRRVCICHICHGRDRRCLVCSG